MPPRPPGTGPAAALLSRARARMSAHLRHLARGAWADRAAAAGTLTAPTAALQARIGALSGLDLRVEAQLRALHRRVEAEALRAGPFVADMTIEAALRRHPGARAALARRQLPACDRCAVRHDETVEEAAAAYGFALPVLLDELNALLSSPRRPSPHGA